MNFNVKDIKAIGLYTKGNFFDIVAQDLPKTMEKFKLWLLDYEQQVKWDSLFGNFDRVEKYGQKVRAELLTIKIEHIPMEMQIGILLSFLRSENATIYIPKSHDITQMDVQIQAILDGFKGIEEL